MKMSNGDLFIAPKPTASLDDLDTREYDALLCSLGYETRSRTVAEHLGGEPKVHAAGFAHHHTMAYKDNRSYLSSCGAELKELSGRDFTIWMADRLAQQQRRIAIDISSMSRPRIAATVQALRQSTNREVIVDFLYVPQRYDGPPENTDIPAALEPVSSDFAGWYPDVDRSLVVLFGLGYEPLRASGAIDALEPDMAIPFFPFGNEEGFAGDVLAANETVFNLPNVEQARPYRLDDPFGCFAELDSLVSYYAGGGSRLLLLPLGPKIFALVCILVAAMRSPVTPVWRVSPGPLDKPVDRLPGDIVVTMSVSPTPIEMD
jgi:hypothetical protein